MSAIAIALKKNVKESQEKQVERRQVENSRKRKVQSFRIGEKVWLYDKARSKKKGGSLAPRYRGPYKVVDVQKSGNVRLENKKGITLKGWQKPQFVKSFIESEFVCIEKFMLNNKMIKHLRITRKKL